MDYTINMGVEKTKNITTYDVYINGDFYGSDITQIPINTNDTLQIDIYKEFKNKKLNNEKLNNNKFDNNKFDNNKFDVSFNTVSGKENIYVGLKSSGTSLTQDYIDEMFYDPPKPVTNSTIELNTTLSTPRLDASWDNPIQRRAAFDFLGTLGPKKDVNPLIGSNSKIC